MLAAAVGALSKQVNKIQKKKKQRTSKLDRKHPSRGSKNGGEKRNLSLEFAGTRNAQELALRGSPASRQPFRQYSSLDHIF